MRHLRTITSALLILLSTAGLHSQETIPATGGDASGSGGTVAYSIGQVIYTTNTGATGAVSQGVQQPHKILTVGINETALNISLSIFPNPTTEYLTLQVKNYNNKKLSYQLFDIQGKLLGSKVITTSKTQINLSDLSTGTYLINVIQENIKVQAFKIIKS